MTRRGAKRGLAGGVVCFLCAVGLVGTFLWQDRGSLERGNRLYRGGQVQLAETLYRASAEPVADSAEALTATPTALYNLGTALLALGTPGAEDYLRFATEAADSSAAQRGHYNRGHRFLTLLEEATESDSWIPLLAAAVGSNRAALRLDPGDENARWNLALSQRLLDDLSAAVERREAPPDEEAAPDEEELVLPQPGDDEDRAGIQEVEREALAGEDPGPLSEDDALGLVESISDDPEQLLWGILWSHRPDVSSSARSYPGGNW